MRYLPAIFVIAALSLGAQVPTPGGGEGPAPSTAPTPPWPMPRPTPAPPIGKTKKGKNNKEEELEKFSGRLIHVEDNQFAISTDDHRQVIFMVDKTTKFFRGDDAIAFKDLEFGAVLDVEASETEDEEFQAVNVRLHPAPSTVVEKAPADSDNDADADARPKLKYGKPAPVRDASAEDADPDAQERPKLKYGKPEPSHSAEVAEAEPPPDTPAPRVEQPAPPPQSQPDPHKVFLQQARDATGEFTGTLPNFMCVEVVTRYLSDNHAGTVWKPQDVVSTDLIWRDGKEEYKNLTIGGKKVSDPSKVGDRSWSYGEFGTILEDLFSPATAADMQYARASHINHMDAVMYDFDVARERSHWLVIEGGQSITPARTGTVWFDKESKRVLRIEFEAVDIPKTFPADTLEAALDYDYVMLGRKKFLVPVHAETLDCHRGMAYCTKNVIDFRNYHRFGSESDIQFSEDAPAPALAPGRQPKK